MSNKNQAQQATIADIVKDKFFEIPPYQRLYEWEKDEIETLLDDIKTAYDKDKDKQYFIGNITTSKNGDRFVLIDGQQRLTTLWFVGFYLASKNCGEWKEFISQGEKLRIAMPIRDNEEKALKELANNIAENLSQSLLGKDVHQKIISAFDCIEKWFAGENGIDLNAFAKFIYEEVCFVFVELAQNTDLNRFFVRMNNRGKQLEKHEILKVRILGVIQQGGGEWQKYAKIWDLCSDMNKYIFQSASDRKPLDSENEGGKECGIDDIIANFKGESAKIAQNDTPDKVESIIDFPTFLLHCFKLHTNSDISITKDKLLEIFDLSKMSGESCKEFIADMLYYRVLFDYFVIKNTLSDDGFAIMRLNKGTYQAKSKAFAELTMIQNYLRVARQGDRQNYHHWLTPFLKYLSEDNDNKSLKECLNFETKSWNPNTICEKFTKEIQQSKFSSFLEILDTNLAITQLNGSELLGETNKAIKETQHYQPAKITENPTWDFLNNGTATPHYWFYRLEYYLWKGRDNFKGVTFNKQDFKNIAEKFHFRNLNSVEHIQPQSRAEENGWEIHNKGTKDEKRDIDCFGNLALLSVGFNSALSNQDSADKKIELQKKINKSEVESLKLWLIYAQYIAESNEWSYTNAQEHQSQMIDILIESLGLTSNDSQNSSES